jgi:hypothetical protein
VVFAVVIVPVVAEERVSVGTLICRPTAVIAASVVAIPSFRDLSRREMAVRLTNGLYDGDAAVWPKATDVRRPRRGRSLV